jgi:hypothetical protein
LLTAGWARHLLRNTGNELVGEGGLARNREVPVDAEATTNAELTLAAQHNDWGLTLSLRLRL